MSQRTQGQIAVRTGLWFGLLGGVLTFLQLVLVVVGVVKLQKTPTVVNVAFFLAEAAVLFGAGVMAARASGQVRTGLLAGVIASVVASVLGILVSLLQALVAPQSMPADVMAQPGVELLMTGLGLLVNVALGAGLGALGGALSRMTSRPFIARGL